MTLVVGLTGGIASGKSTVSNMLQNMGYEIIDADIEARNAVQKGEMAYQEIIKLFGVDILEADVQINRAKLGDIIFRDENKRKQLNAIVHPDVRRRMREKRDRLVTSGTALVVLDIPLLFESGLTEMVEKTLLVYVDESVQLDRLMRRNNLTKEAALARITSQMPIEKKLDLADYVINNNGTIQDTEEQLTSILRQWKIITS